MPTRGRPATSPDVETGDIEPQIVTPARDGRQLSSAYVSERDSSPKRRRTRERRVQAIVGAMKKAGQLAQPRRELLGRRSPQRHVPEFTSAAGRFAIQMQMRVAHRQPSDESGTSPIKLSI